MIAQGTDGLSRGEFASGVMEGSNFLKLLPLNETALERQLNLRSKISGWVPVGEWRFATTKDWFHEVFKVPKGGFTKGGWIWTPSPALAKVAVEQMCEVKHMHPSSKHIFICPSLMTGYWKRMLGKVADSMFTFKAGSSLWHADMHEPLTIAFVSPLLSRKPWKASRLPSMAKWEHELHNLPRKDCQGIRSHMRKFWVPRK